MAVVIYDYCAKLVGLSGILGLFWIRGVSSET